MDYCKAFSLSGRAALITGGGSGIGRACARIFAQAGASVMIVGRRLSKLQEVCREIRDHGGICEVFSADLSYEKECCETVQACVETFGRLDILLNSAGSRGANGNLEEEFTSENLRHTMDADFNSTFYMIKYTYPECSKQGGGSIINIASLAALSARGPLVYSAAKGAIKSFSRTLAKRLGPSGIRVNTIYPGFIVTEMTKGIFEKPELEAHFREESPLGLIGESSDIAYCSLYLASDASRFVTGQDFVIDGGATC